MVAPSPGPEFAIGVVDVGSPRGGKLGWAVLVDNQIPRLGHDLDAFVDLMGNLGATARLTIGFEAPLFVPARSAALDVLAARQGEGSRPWSAGAGAAVTTAALAVVTYTLARLRERLPSARPSLTFGRPIGEGEVLFFEAFVTGAAKHVDHAHDALVAAQEAQRLLASPAEAKSAIDEPAVLSLLGAGLLHAGWSTNLTLLSTACFVVKPQARVTAI